MKAIYSLWFRDLIRFFRQKKRVMSMMGQPLITWLLLGYCFYHVYPGMNFIEFLLPGIICMVALFTSIFSSFSTIDDRSAGFLQGVIVSPIASYELVLGKVLGGATVSLLQACVFLILAPLFGIQISISHIPLILFSLSLASLSVTAFGFYFAWKMNTTSEFHDVMMLMFLPMWFMSGAIYKLDVVPAMIQKLLYLNPMTHVVALVRHSIYGERVFTHGVIPSFLVSLCVTSLFGLLFFGASCLRVKHEGS